MITSGAREFGTATVEWIVLAALSLTWGKCRYYGQFQSRNSITRKLWAITITVNLSDGVAGSGESERGFVLDDERQTLELR
jgi:hypothetical protein